MLERFAYVVAIAFPFEENPAFAEFARAVVTCWFHGVDVTDPARVEIMVRERLDCIQWHLSRIEYLSHEVDLSDAHNRERLRQVVIDKFVADVDQVPREVVHRRGEADGRSVSPPDMVLQEYRTAIQRQASLYSLWSGERRRFVSSRTLNDNDYLPLWLSESAARSWRSRWPRSRVREVPPGEIHRLLAAAEENGYVGLECGHDALCTFSPASLIEAVRVAET